ncbi:MAG: hypothetical protein GC153_05185 [Alphaproteobacteria bacterium]|nr:hypothetical protein [Alphaproteobacteria bacterium]
MACERRRRLTLHCGAAKFRRDFKARRSQRLSSGMPMADDAGKQKPPSLDEFSKRLNAARGDNANAEATRAGTGSAMGRAFRVASELVAALFVGMLLGMGIDKLTGMGPLFLLIGLGFGFAAGLLNVSRAMKEMDKKSSGNG